MSSEGNYYPNNPYLLASNPRSVPAASSITQLLGIDGTNHITCSACKRVREKHNMTHVVDLIYPKKVCPFSYPLSIHSLIGTQVAQTEQSSPSFSNILRMSLFRQITHKAVCPSCKHFATFFSRRSTSTHQLPPVLAINASVYDDDSFSFWQDARNSTFLQPHITLRGQVDGIDEKDEIAYDVRVSIILYALKQHLYEIRQ